MSKNSAEHGPLPKQSISPSPPPEVVLSFEDRFQSLVPCLSISLLAAAAVAALQIESAVSILVGISTGRDVSGWAEVRESSRSFANTMLASLYLANP